MDPISKLSRLLETIRSQQISGNRSKKQVVSSSGEINQTNKSTNPRSKPSIKQLSNRISERLNHLSDSEQSSSKAIQVFIDSVLAWEFGDDFLQSNSFFSYSEKVRDVIANDKKLSHEFDLLINQLTKK
ncbi:hypothetical protein [Candidatus Thiodiazotropha endoloripes]|uniref:hypothetical protein n=1 Tax=Candidatus Thiodiazotropha endoloripes TaxID=1818881 RepID=UPI0011126DC5|nr:hypothetical protein [Candidatus Thiodiazotropha endoloripes]